MTRYILKEHEKIIVNQLRKNSRTTLKELSEKANISISNTFKIIKKLSLEKYIISYSSLIDFDKIQLSRFFFFLSNKNPIKEHTIDFILNSNNINNIHRVDDGYICEGVFESMDQYTIFFEKLHKQGVISMPIIEEEKRESFFLS